MDMDNQIIYYISQENVSSTLLVLEFRVLEAFIRWVYYEKIWVYQPSVPQYSNISSA